jgi:hypothetical protein
MSGFRGARDESERLHRYRLRSAEPLEEATRFGLFMMKAVLDGRARESIDLAKVNFER